MNEGSEKDKEKEKISRRKYGRKRSRNSPI